MQKYIKTVSKILFVAIVLILLYKVYDMTFQEQLKVEQNNIKTFEVSQEDIISSGQEIIIKSFDEIYSLKWIDESKLLIDGIIENQESTFIFDLTLNELVFADQESSQIDYGDYTFIKSIPSFGVLCSKGNSLGLLNEQDYFVIAENATYDGSLKFALSDDLSKLLYYHHDKATLVTYNFEKNFYRTINVTLTEEMLENFNQLIQISPIGGYVSVEHRQDLEDTFFSIYGADSGRIYADEVYGMYLAWSDLDEYVTYYYTKESQVESNGLKDIEISSNRIGYYDVENKSIDYLESSRSEQSHLSNFYWNGKKVTVLNGSIEDQISIQNISSYDFETHTFLEWDVELETFDLGVDLELLEYDDAYILTAVSSKEHHAYRILKDSHEVIAYENLEGFDLIDQDQVYFYSKSGTFVNLNQEQLTISKDAFQGYMTIKESNFKVVPSENMTYMAVWLLGSSEIRILKIN